MEVVARAGGGGENGVVEDMLIVGKWESVFKFRASNKGKDIR